jgi:hypothetical protein
MLSDRGSKPPGHVCPKYTHTAPAHNWLRLAALGRHACRRRSLNNRMAGANACLYCRGPRSALAGSSNWKPDADGGMPWWLTTFGPAARPAAMARAKCCSCTPKSVCVCALPARQALALARQSSSTSAETFHFAQTAEAARSPCCPAAPAARQGRAICLSKPARPSTHAASLSRYASWSSTGSCVRGAWRIGVAASAPTYRKASRPNRHMAQAYTVRPTWTFRCSMALSIALCCTGGAVPFCLHDPGAHMTRYQDSCPSEQRDNRGVHGRACKWGSRSSVPAIAHNTGHRNCGHKEPSSALPQSTPGQRHGPCQYLGGGHRKLKQKPRSINHQGRASQIQSTLPTWQIAQLNSLEISSLVAWARAAPAAGGSAVLAAPSPLAGLPAGCPLGLWRTRLGSPLCVGEGGVAQRVAVE